MNVLCNLPLDCFAPRSTLRHRVVTFGPTGRMWVDGVLYPFDVAFDPASGSIEELLASLPRDFEPDLVLFYWPDQEPLPDGLERCPVPVVGVLSDYNLSLPYVAGLWPLFDMLLVDRPGVELFRRLSFADVRPFCQFTFKVHHRLYPDVARDLDVAFAGNLNPVVQRDRARWIRRLLRLGESGPTVAVTSGLYGEGYGRFLNRARLGFNRSIRGEMNLRAFEVPACGALLLMEEENEEVRDFLAPGEEVVLYGEHDFEEVVLDLLADEPRRARIARAGHERIQEHGLARRLDELECELAQPGPGRPSSTAFDRALGRGVAMIPTWAPVEAPLRCLLQAAQIEPCDPRVLNALALAMLRDGGTRAQEAAELLRRACEISPTYVPGAHNLASLLEAGGCAEDAQKWFAAVEARLGAVQSWQDLDGPVLPLGYSERAVAVAHGLGQAVRRGDFSGHLGAWAPAHAGVEGRR